MVDSFRTSWEETFSGKQRDQLVESFGPADLMAVARALVEELLVGQRQQRAVAIGLEQHRDQRFALRRAMPGPGEHELLVRPHLAVDAPNLVLAVPGVRGQPIAPANTQVGLRLGALDPPWPEPAR